MIGAVNPILDGLKPTRKELIIENLYKDGNISKMGAGGQYGMILMIFQNQQSGNQ